MSMGAVVPLLREVPPKRQTPVRKPNAELRTREHLAEQEVQKLIEAAKDNRNGHRDACMILIAYRHGLRARSLSICAGSRCTSAAPTSMSAGARRARPARTRSAAENCGLCASSSGTKIHRHRSCSPRSARCHSPPRASPACCSVPPRPPGSPSRSHPHMLRHACGFKLANDGCRYPSAAGVPRAQEHPAHGQVHRAGAGPLQRILEGLRNWQTAAQLAGSSGATCHVRLSGVSVVAAGA